MYKVTAYTTPLKAERQYNTLPQDIEHTRVQMCKDSILKTVNQVHQWKHSAVQLQAKRNTFYFLKLKCYPKKTITFASDCYNLEVTSTSTPSAKTRILTLQWANQNKLKLINLWHIALRRRSRRRCYSCCAQLLLMSLERKQLLLALGYRL